VGAELLHADGRTDRMNRIVAFRNFANAAKKEGGKQKIKRSNRWLVDRKKSEDANLLIELKSNKSCDFQNYRRTASQLFQNSLLLIWSTGAKCCNEGCCNCMEGFLPP